MQKRLQHVFQFGWNDQKALLTILLVAILAFFQVIFNLHPLKYDAIDCFLPWRFHIGECLQNGQFPFWNAYQDLGYPIHADPSSGAWYPLVWLIGGVFGYNIYTLNLEFLIHVFFAGWGFYKLGKTLNFSYTTALIGGISYMLCGVIIGNAQHLPYIISAAWIPFILNHYLITLKYNSLFDASKAAFFLFLMLTGGYPAFTFILFYLFLFLFLYHLFTILKNKKKRLAPFLVSHITFIFLTLILSIGLFTSIIQVRPYLSRLGDFTLEQALFSPFSPQSFISFIFPLSSTTQTDFFQSDLSMRNAYFGLILFILFILSSFKKKPFEIRLFFWFGLICLAVSVGDALPFRTFLFNHVPLMNLFRFPSVFRLFFIIGGIISGLMVLESILSDPPAYQKKLSTGLIILIGSLIVLIVTVRMQGYLNLKVYLQNDLFSSNSKATIWQNIVLQAILHLSLLSILFISVRKFIKSKHFSLVALSIIVIDLVLATQLNAPLTVYSDQISAKDAQNNLNRYQKGFPKLKTKTIAEASTLPHIGQPFWQNTNTFQKEITTLGYNSFSFVNYEKLESEFPQFYKAIEQNNLILLSDHIFSNQEMLKAKKDSSFTSNQLYFNSQEFAVLNVITMKKNQGDTAFLTSYDALNFNIQSKTSETQLLTLFQKNYPGWKATCNGKKIPIYTSNLNFITIVLPEGKNTIQFSYDNKPLEILFIIHIILLVIIVLNLLAAGFRKIKTG